jgi:hypothetical protein
LRKDSDEKNPLDKKINNSDAISSRLLLNACISKGELLTYSSLKLS